MFASDRAVTEYENDVLGYTDEIMLEQLGKHQDTQHLSSFDKSLLYLNNNRWSFIGKFVCGLYQLKRDSETKRVFCI